MQKSLKESINETALFASLPMGFIGDDPIENDSDAENALCDIVRLLHRISNDESKLPNFYETIDKDDLFKINLFLTERLYCLRHIEEEK